MDVRDQPLISVVTPVYNGEAFLEQCIESVLAQTYTNWEYIVVNNCSSDRTGEIAERYARKDKRIQLHTNSVLLKVIANHNYALGLISPESKYCKVVSADDLIFPECLARMAELAEANPSVGIVGSYQLSGGGDEWVVRCTGLPYWRTVVSGKDACRTYLLNGVAIFGAPTSNMYRSDLVRSSDGFYPNPRAEADVSACVKHLRDCDFGFVHQVLSYERCHGDRITTGARSMDAYSSSRISDLQDYGSACATAPELEKRLQELLNEYYVRLAIAAVNFRERSYWTFQKKRLAELGYRLDYMRLGVAVCAKLFDMLVNPKETLAKLRRRSSSAFAPSAAPALPKHGRA
jgi:glycosyltransferase involved in cell wall biosynthesis